MLEAVGNGANVGLLSRPWEKEKKEKTNKSNNTYPRPLGKMQIIPRDRGLLKQDVTTAN